MPIYNDLIDSYYRAWFRYHPESAVDLGVDGYATQLTPFADDEIGALTSLHAKLIDSVDELNSDALNAEQLIDIKLMRGQALLERKRLLEQDWRSRDPARFLPINAIYQLTIREVNQPEQAFQKRLRAIPHYLRAARIQLNGAGQHIPSLWLESAISEAQAGVGYLRSLQQHPRLQSYRINSELDEAAHAVQEFAGFLQQDIGQRAQGDFACGRDMYETLLKYKHSLDISCDQLYTVGEQLFEQTWQRLQEVTHSLRNDTDVQALTRSIQAEFKPEKDLLDEYRQCMQAAREFVAQRQLVSMPEKETLAVVETPVFLRHQIPFAAYYDPVPTDPRQQGYYYVTKPESEESWGEHNLLSIKHTCVHEAWPGHHLQFVSANQRPEAHTLPRLLNTSATLYEGWALYCEQLMHEQGFVTQPESEFILLKDRLWRALRIKLDVALHTRGLGIEAAATQMQELLGFSREQALADLDWYTRSPTIPMSYATGWLLINKTRERLQSMDSQFALRTFHDKLLSSGSIALATVLRRQFGQPLWNSVHQAVFGSVGT